MRILLLSIVAKCGVFTHVRDLAFHLQKRGLEPVIGMVHNPATKNLFKVSEMDIQAMEASLEGIPRFYYSSGKSLLDQIRDKEFTLIHSHSPLTLPTAMALAGYMDIPFVVTLHGVIHWSKHYHHELSAAKGIIAIGPEVAKSAGPEFQDKIHIIYNGIDTEHFRPGDNSSYDNTLRIVWLGRTSGAASSGAEYLAKAIQMLRRQGADIEAKVIGHPLGANVRGMEVCGWAHDILPYLQWSHMAFARGRALREAMACGNAGFLLAEGYGGLVRPKWFQNGNHVQLSGALKHGFSKLNVSQIAKDILFFYQNRDYLEKARNIARKIAVEYFDINNMVDDTCKIYEHAIRLYENDRYSVP